MLAVIKIKRIEKIPSALPRMQDCRSPFKGRRVLKLMVSLDFSHTLFLSQKYVYAWLMQWSSYNVQKSRKLSDETTDF